jgi:hypothetical protein
MFSVAYCSLFLLPVCWAKAFIAGTYYFMHKIVKFIVYWFIVCFLAFLLHGHMVDLFQFAYLVT